MSEATSPADEQRIRATHATYIAAVNAADLERVLALMTHDVVLFSPGQAPFGRDAFPAGFLRGHADFELRCVSEIEEVVVVGEVAYTRCRDSLSLRSRADGAASALAGYRISIYRRQPDGGWLLARDAHTLAPTDVDGA